MMDRKTTNAINIKNLRSMLKENSNPTLESDIVFLALAVYVLVEDIEENQHIKKRLFDIIERLENAN